MYAGAVSGGIECIAVWPMENIKTQLQLMKVCPACLSSLSFTPCLPCTNTNLPPAPLPLPQLPKDGSKPPFTGMIGGFRHTISTTGFFSLYKGLDVTLLGAVPKAGIRFGANAYCKELLRGEDGKLGSAQQVRVCVCVCVCVCVWPVLHV